MTNPDTNTSEQSLPSLGLSGVWASVANFSAVVIMGGLFVFILVHFTAVAAEDRKMCREEATKQWQAVREGQQALMRLTRSVEEIGQEVRALRSERNPK